MARFYNHDQDIHIDTFLTGLINNQLLRFYKHLLIVYEEHGHMLQPAAQQDRTLVAKTALIIKRK